MRVSTSDQSCERQVPELIAFAERGGYDVVGVFKETASGASVNRTARNRLLAPKVLQAIKEGRSYRWIARDLGISKNTVSDIVKRNRQEASSSPTVGVTSAGSAG
ncbi:recombinase family protein [Sulfitobacter sp. 1A13368]|uniref:recombinase family protein n=1 Tax=unclassified Sulfitobacter TaxID=196795 RepID=UPI0037469695